MTVVEFIISNTVPWWSLLAATGQLLINIFSNVAMMAYAFFNANGIAFWLPENHQEDKGLLIFNGSMIIKEVMGLLLSQFVSIIKALPYAHFDCISDSSKIPTYVLLRRSQKDLNFPSFGSSAAGDSFYLEMVWGKLLLLLNY